MKGKKLIDNLCIIIFFLLMLVPLAYTNFEVDAISEKDNRSLAESPIKASLTGTRFADAVDAYFSDRIGFRENFISMNGWISYSVFNKSPVGKVVIGEDGWLFYNGEKAGDGTPITQFLGRSNYSAEQLETIANNLINTREYLKENGVNEFVLFIAPNKERVYAEYMPALLRNARVSEEDNTVQLVDYLRENTDIRVVYPYDALMDYKESNPDEPLYYHLDTHWNELGGYIGARELLKELGVKIPEPENESHNIVYGNSGDLFNMMGVSDWLNMDEISWEMPNWPNESTVVDEGEFIGHWRYTNTNMDERILLVERDSFCSAMRNELGSSFNEVDLVHRGSYTQQVLEEDAPDIFVYQLVERYDNNLLTPGMGIIPEDILATKEYNN